MKIQILVDNPNSWMVPHAQDFCSQMENEGVDCKFLSNHDDVVNGDVLVLLSCEKMFKDYTKNKYNLVVHESDLPKGKGWSPMTWQVMEGSDEIVVTLFEAAEKVDSGVIYFQEKMMLDGTELINELREKQALVTFSLVKKFMNAYPDISGSEQVGEESFYPKRGPKNSMLSLDKSLAEQFNLLRIVDNERYPAYFEKDGVKYVLKIEKEDA